MIVIIVHRSPDWSFLFVLWAAHSEVGLVSVAHAFRLPNRFAHQSFFPPAFLTATAIFNSKITSSLFPRVAAALIPLGIPPAEVGHFIGLLMAGDIPGVLAIPGMTPQILGIGGAAQKSAFSYALKYVWIFVAGKSRIGPDSRRFF